MVDKYLMLIKFVDDFGDVSALDSEVMFSWLTGATTVTHAT